MVNSASVVGGCPETVQLRAPAQSPVSQWPLPLLKEQPVRPQNLPVVPAGTSTVHVCPGSSCVPPPTGMAAGHTMETAVVFDGEGGRVGTGGEGSHQEEEEDRGHGSGCHGCSSQVLLQFSPGGLEL